MPTYLPSLSFAVETDPEPKGQSVQQITRKHFIGKLPHSHSYLNGCTQTTLIHLYINYKLDSIRTDSFISVDQIAKKKQDSFNPNSHV